ncbi:MAG: hypothetical protein PV340_00965 [Wolbachia sp.]|nr:hypothetical protein [Wolbachia sp.]
MLTHQPYYIKSFKIFASGLLIKQYYSNGFRITNFRYSRRFFSVR